MLGRALLWAAEKPAIERLVSEGKLTRGVVERFVAGATLDDAIAAIRQLNARQVGGILDLLGEGVADPAGASEAFDAYLASIKRIDETDIDTTVSVKLTQLGLSLDKGACIDYVRRLAAEADALGATVEIDMEQSQYVTDTLDVYCILRKDFDNLRIAIQAYLRRSPVDLESIASLRPKVRLVKGAYAEPEHVAFQKRKEIDAQYAFLTDWLFEKGADPALATHDGRLIEHAKRVAQQAGAGMTGFEVQMLYGIRRDLQYELAALGYRVRTYVPFGSAWYPYLMRRLAERPANTMFFLRALAGR
ncbi:MAG TPA: proline dehydrogenase family protein [Actinomycetota bacterium]|nr:proline dehydrogenase family protein [Actinomycetota bacterium]